MPWDDAGAHVRFSVTFSAPTPEDEIKIVNEIKNRLKEYTFLI